MKYHVFYSYTPWYDDEGVAWGRIDWEWTIPPVDWEDYAQVRTYLAKEKKATRVQIYAVIPVEEFKQYRGIKNWMYQNGTRKTGTEKPWEDHAEANGG
jgi:hypothetical protein